MPCPRAAAGPGQGLPPCTETRTPQELLVTTQHCFYTEVLEVFCGAADGGECGTKSGITSKPERTATKTADHAAGGQVCPSPGIPYSRKSLRGTFTSRKINSTCSFLLKKEALKQSACFKAIRDASLALSRCPSVCCQHCYGHPGKQMPFVTTITVITT